MNRLFLSIFILLINFNLIVEAFSLFSLLSHTKLQSRAFSIYSSNDYTFNEHYLRISEKKAKLSELKIGFKYFIKSLEANKFFEIEVANIKDNIIHTDNNQVFLFNNYEWYFYISNLDFDFDIIFDFFDIDFISIFCIDSDINRG